MIALACASGHMEFVRHLLKLGLKDTEGPDSLNGLALALGQLDSDLVSMLANTEVQPKSPEFLGDIVDELDQEIAGEKSVTKREKMEMLRSVIVDQKIHEKFFERPPCSRASTPLADQK